MTILVTGAAGLLGGEIAAELAARGHAVIGLVNRNREVRHGDGALAETRDWDGRHPGKREIALVTGDVSAPCLGLNDADYRSIAGQTDAIIHCAAITAFDAAPELYEAVNVGGTREMLDLAGAADASYVQVSTAYVCGERDGMILEEDSRPPEKFANRYEQSKFEAELLVRIAMSKGRPAAIARPSVVVGRESDGAISGFDTVYGAFKLLAEGRMGTIPARADATIDFVAIDYVVNGIVTIAERIDEAAGRTFHLASAEPMTVADFFALIGSYDQFEEPGLVSPDDFDVAQLAPVKARMHRRVAPLYQTYFCRNILFRKDNADALLGGPGPRADREFMKRQIDFAIRAGYLRSHAKAA